MASRVLIVAPGWLGDAVMALPAIGVVRRHRPDDALIVAARGSLAPLFQMVPGVDEVVPLCSAGGLRGAMGWGADVRALGGARADIAILLPNSFRSAWVARRAGVGERWGYARDARGRLLTRRVEPPRGSRHQADYYLALMAGLGIEAGGAPPRLQPPEEACRRADSLLAEHGIADGRLLVGMAPGAAYGRAKQWPPDRYAAVARSLHDRFDVVSLIVGSRQDLEAASDLERAIRWTESGRAERAPGPIVNLVGRTDLPVLAGVLARCRAFVSNDSGAMHLAAASGLPVTAIFGSTNERETASVAGGSPGTPPHAILTCQAWCRPCMLRECPIDHRCMTGIEPARVVEAVGAQIDRGGRTG